MKKLQFAGDLSILVLNKLKSLKRLKSENEFSVALMRATARNAAVIAMTKNNGSVDMHLLKASLVAEFELAISYEITTIQTLLKNG